VKEPYFLILVQFKLTPYITGGTFGTLLIDLISLTLIQSNHGYEVKEGRAERISG
jgi:hypothetical protein